MKAHFTNEKNFRTTFNIFGTFNLAKDTKCTLEWAAMWILYFFVETTMSPILKSSMSAATSVAHVYAHEYLPAPLGQIIILLSHSEDTE